MKTAVEEPGLVTRELGVWKLASDGRFRLSAARWAARSRHKDAHGAALVAQLGPDEFLVTGVDASMIFHLPGKLPWMRSQVLSAEQGTYENGVWKPLRLWNGDETDRGLSFHNKPTVVRVKMQRF